MSWSCKKLLREQRPHNHNFFYKFGRLQRKKWQKYVQIMSDSTQHPCEIIMSHEFLLKWTDIWRFTILVAQHTSPMPSTLPRHVLCRTTMLYQVVRLNFCPCGRTLKLLMQGVRWVVRNVLLLDKSTWVLFTMANYEQLWAITDVYMACSDPEWWMIEMVVPINGVGSDPTAHIKRDQSMCN